VTDLCTASPRDFLLVAGPASRPAALLRNLSHHPEIVAPPPMSIGMALHQAARVAMRSEPAGDFPATVAVGRQNGGIALAQLFQSVRADAGDAAVVILHDPSGPLFPFLEPPAVSLLVLVRNAEAAAAAIGAVGIERVVAAARDALTAFQARVASFGIPVERLVSIEEDRLDADPEAGLAEVCRILGVAADPATIAAMLDPERVDVRARGDA